MGKIHCEICKKKCRGDVLKLDKKFMHKTCFNCSECGSNLEKGGFFCRDSRYYCAVDYQRRFGVKCGLCEHYVEGEAVTILGSTFHMHCFKCQLCRSPFQCGDKASLWEGQYLCDRCSVVAAVGGKENISPVLNGSGPRSVLVPGVTPGAGVDVSGTAVVTTVLVDSSDTEGESASTAVMGAMGGRPSQFLQLHLDTNGYTSTDSGVEKTKSEMAYLSQHSPEYSMTSGDESWVHSTRGRKSKTNPYQFGKYINESYLKIQERLGRTNPPRSTYGGPKSAQTANPSSAEARNQFHRPTNFSYRSIPNIHSKRGMSLLIGSSNTVPSRQLSAQFHKSQSLTAPPIRGASDRVVVNGDHRGTTGPRERPQSTNDLSMTEHVKRLSQFPNATEPDPALQPPIDRYDFPAPPSLSVVLQDRKRAKRQSAASSQMGECLRGYSIQSTGDITMTTNGGMTTTATSGTESEDEQQRRRKRERQIQELRLIRNRSGMSQSLLDELEEGTDQMDSNFLSPGPYIDPVSSSRSPDAASEPPQRPRFDRHTFTSPSRDSRFEGRPMHSLSYRTNYSSTGGRTGNLSGYNSSTARLLNRGYMSCVEDGRAVNGRQGNGSRSSLSLPHPHDPAAASTIATVSLSTTTNQELPIGGPRHHGSSQQPPHGQHQRGGGGGYMNGHHHMSASTYSMDATTTLSMDESTLIGSSGLLGAGMVNHHGAGGHHGGGGWLTESDTEALMLLQSPVCYPTVQSFLRPCSTGSAAGADGGGGASSNSISKFLRLKDKVPAQIYPYELLKISNFSQPKGVDREQLETYLSDGDFELVFQMSRYAFRRLPEWKRNDLKRKVDLY